MSALNYNRMPGFGDLPGDSTNPNSPDYVEPEYGVDDAQNDVAENLIRMDEVGALVSDVYDATGLLDWVAKNAELPAMYRAAFRNLDRRAREICRAVDGRMESQS